MSFQNLQLIWTSFWVWKLYIFLALNNFLIPFQSYLVLFIILEVLSKHFRNWTGSFVLRYSNEMQSIPFHKLKYMCAYVHTWVYECMCMSNMSTLPFKQQVPGSIWEPANFLRLCGQWLVAHTYTHAERSVSIVWDFRFNHKCVTGQIRRSAITTTTTQFESL